MTVIYLINGKFKIPNIKKLHELIIYVNKYILKRVKKYIELKN